MDLLVYQSLSNCPATVTVGYIHFAPPLMRCDIDSEVILILGHPFPVWLAFFYESCCRETDSTVLGFYDAHHLLRRISRAHAL
jgi:hypothetical protein